MHNESKSVLSGSAHDEVYSDSLTFALSSHRIFLSIPENFVDPANFFTIMKRLILNKQSSLQGTF